MQSEPNPLVDAFDLELSNGVWQTPALPCPPGEVFARSMKPPVSRTPEIIEHILRELAEGKFMSVICRQEGMPSTQSIHNWRKADPLLHKLLEEARLLGCDKIAEECLDIADDGSQDMGEDNYGRPVLNTDNIQRSKLRIWARLELLKKMYPAKYGEKIDLNVGGQVGNPIRLIASNMTQEEATNLYLQTLNEI